MNHPYIVKLRDVICVPDKLNLIFDYVETDLKTYVEKNRPLAENQVKTIMYQILSGIAYCHSQAIIH